MMSAGTWIRTIAALHPQQMWGRPSYKLRRALAPHLGGIVRPWGFRAMSASDLPLPPTVASEEQVEALRGGQLALVGSSGKLPNAAPWSLGCADPLYVYEFHQLSWLVATLRSLPQNDPFATQLKDWLNCYLDSEHMAGSPYWDAYPLATRLLSLLPLFATGQLSGPVVERALRSWAIAILALQETHLKGNHLLRSRAAAAAGSLFITGPGTDGLVTSCWKELAREAERQFYTDGVHEERTPAYHLLCASDLLTCVALASASRSQEIVASRDRIERIAGRAVAAAEAFTHDDGRVAAFGDSAPQSALRLDDLRAFATALGIQRPSTLDHGRSAEWERRTATDSGFSALRGKDIAVFLSHGEFGARNQPGHAHCDLFSFEVDLDGHRMIVDPGVHAYHDPEWRQRSRSSFEHLTPSISGREQAEIWSRFRCGWRPAIESAAWVSDEAGSRVDLRAMAFGPGPILLKRDMTFRDGAVLIEDELPTAFSVAVPLAPEVDVQLSGSTALLQHPKASKGLRVVVKTGEIALEPCAISHGFGARTRSTRLRLTSDRTARLAWSVQA